MKEMIKKELSTLTKPYLQSWKESKDFIVNVNIQMDENKYDPLTGFTMPAQIKGTKLELIIKNKYSIVGQLANGFSGTIADTYSDREEVEVEIDKTIETVLTDLLENDIVTQGFELKQRG